MDGRWRWKTGGGGEEIEEDDRWRRRTGRDSGPMVEDR